MTRTGITGGIGSGKSYVCRLLEEQGICVYDCDSNAKRLMVEDAKIRKMLTRLVGEYAYIKTPDKYALNKSVIARFLMSSPENAEALDKIVHPAVFDDFLSSGMEWVESAILFESGLNCFVDRVVVVTAPEEVRIDRVMKRDGISREKALEWIHCQMPQDYLVSQADFVISNDGQTPLLPQISRLLATSPKYE